MITKTVVAAAVLAAALTPAVAGTAAATPMWADCADPAHPGYQCATLDVPMSYQDPGAGTVQVALGKLPAVDQTHKLGTIFYNPGGPGVSGRFAPALTPASHQRYDIVGFDPRGVGASTPLRCFTDPAQLDVLAKALGRFPLTQAQNRDQLAATRTVTDLCGANGGPILAHLSTANVARDLDRIRAAVGEPKLRYYGKSYGTVLGETYANLFPDHVGAMVLDAVDDPVNWFTGYRPQDAKVPFSVRLGGFHGAADALHTFLTACAASDKCAFRGGDLMAKYDALQDRLTRGPVTITDPGTGEQAVVDYPAFVNRVHAGLVDQDVAVALGQYLQAVRIAPAPTARLAAATIPTPVDSLLGGGTTLCADALGPQDPTVWWHYKQVTDRQVRGFGASDTYKSLPCATWPDRDPDTYRGPWNHRTAPVLLLSNRLGDPETPYAGAKRAEGLLGNARLLALDAYGHGSVGKSACIDKAVDGYFGAGALPRPGAVCQPNHRPFD